MEWIAFAVLVWAIGGGCHWWPGPIDATRLMSDRVRMSWTQRRSEAVSEDIGHGEDMSGHDDDDDPEGDFEDIAGGALRVSREHVATRWGPLPELADLAGHDDPESGPDDEGVEPTPGDVAERQRWVAQQMRAGRPPGWIDERGAARYGVTAKTIYRDRRELAPKGGSR